MNTLLRNFLCAFSLFGFALYSCENNDRYAFDDWDDDANELVSENEFNSTFDEIGYYDDWDLDNDDMLDETEWQTGINTYYSDYDVDAYGDFDDWNANDDEFLDEDEFRTGTFTVWDMDRDGNIEVVEYEEWTSEL